MSGMRTLGNTAMKVVPVGLGCMGFSHAYGAPTQKQEAVRMIRAAYEMGYNFFDTAECYIGTNEDGSTSYNEELVGEALADVRDTDMPASADIEAIRQAYMRMYDGMISKDEKVLNDVLDDSFVLVHMTGMRQPKQAFIKAVLNGTLNYFSAEHENMPVEISGDTVVLTGQSYVAAAVFGGGRHNRHLQQKCSLKKTDGVWKITRSVASTY